MPKTILITGGCGFLGHHVVEHILRNTDYNVTILDRLNYAGNMNYLADISIWPMEGRRVRFVYHDLLSAIPEFVDIAIGDFNYVVHLAAETHVDRSLSDAIPFVLSNCLGTTNLLEWLKKKPFEKMINFSTDEVFGSAPEDYEYSEDDRYRPSNPYAASKCGQEALAYSFANAFKLPIVTLRCMNLFGERQHIEKFVPMTIRNIMLGNPIKLHGKSPQDTSRRCWVHCREVATAILFVLIHGVPKKFYHVVGQEMSVFNVAAMLMSALDKFVEVKYVDYHECRPGHDYRYAMQDNNLSALGWKHSLSADEGMMKMAKWYKTNQRWLQI